MESNNYNLKSEIISCAYEKYFIEIKSYFVSCLHDEMEADDMVQDLFLKLMEYSGIIVEETVKGFIFSIGQRMIIDHGRHQAFVRRSFIDYEQLSFTRTLYYEDCKIDCEQIENVENKYIKMLSPRMAQVYELSRFEQKTVDEMAQDLRIGRRTVEYHLLMSRRLIRSSVKKALNF